MIKSSYMNFEIYFGKYIVIKLISYQIFNTLILKLIFIQKYIFFYIISFYPKFILQILKKS